MFLKRALSNVRLVDLHCGVSPMVCALDVVVVTRRGASGSTRRKRLVRGLQNKSTWEDEVEWTLLRVTSANTAGSPSTEGEFPHLSGDAVARPLLDRTRCFTTHW